MVSLAFDLGAAIVLCMCIDRLLRVWREWSPVHALLTRAATLLTVTCGTHTLEVSTREYGVRWRSVAMEMFRDGDCVFLSSNCSNTTCPPGTFRSSAQATTCTECAAGTFNSDPNATQCESCPPHSDISTCSASGPCTCTAGSMGTNGNSPCTLCPTGICIAKETYFHSKRDLYILAQGTDFWSRREGRASCPYIRFTTHFQLARTIFMTWPVCAVTLKKNKGKFSSVSGSSTCLQCLAGKFSPVNGTSACSDCSATYVRDAYNSSAAGFGTTPASNTQVRH